MIGLRKLWELTFKRFLGFLRIIFGQNKPEQQDDVPVNNDGTTCRELVVRKKDKPDDGRQTFNVVRCKVISIKEKKHV